MELCHSDSFCSFFFTQNGFNLLKVFYDPWVSDLRSIKMCWILTDDWMGTRNGKM